MTLKPRSAAALWCWATDEGKASIVVGVTDDLPHRPHSRCRLSAWDRRLWAAKAAVAALIWRKPAAPTPMQPMTRWPRLKEAGGLGALTLEPRNPLLLAQDFNTCIAGFCELGSGIGAGN